MSDFDIIPPQSIDIERVVINSLLLSRRSFQQHIYNICPDYFYSRQHREIFEYMQKNNVNDFVLICEKFPAFASEISYISESQSSDNIKPYVDILRDRRHRRAMIEIATNAIKASAMDYDESAESIHKSMQDKMLKISKYRASSQPEHIRDILPRVFQQFEENSGSGTGILTGLIDVDETAGASMPGDLIIIAARPGMGKSSLALNICRHNAICKNIPVLIFSLEMSKSLTSGRILFSEANSSYDSALKNRMTTQTREAITQTAGNLINCPIMIDDTGKITTSEIYNKAAILKDSFNFGLIIIDHIQLIGLGRPGRSRNEEVSEISGDLLNMARIFNVPVIALSQLSREVEKRNPPRPMLSDLRDSGSLEQDAVKVIFLYRPEYYDKNTDKKGICEIIIAKNRNGPTGVRETIFDGVSMQFVNKAKEYELPEYQW